MSNSTDVLIIGGGPAALVALRLLHLLEYRVRLVAPQGPADSPDIVLPLSTLQSLEPLGLRATVAIAGRPITSHEVHWGGPAIEETPGRDTGLQIPEAGLAAALRRDLPQTLFTHEAVHAVTAHSDGVHVTTGGGVIEASLVLCAVPSLLPPSTRPLPAGPADVATTTTLTDVPLDRFPDGHHFLESGDTGWAWAVRTPRGVQLTRFGEDEDVPPPSRLPAGNVVPGPTRRVTPTHPGLDVGAIVPIGRAAFAVSPLSSLGTAHAIHTASDAVAYANSRLRDTATRPELAAWYVNELRLRAARTHAQTARACADVADGGAGSFWTHRAGEEWRRDLPEPLLRAVTRWQRFMEWSAAERIEERRFRRRVSPTPTSLLVRRGPVVREARGIGGGDAVSVPAAWFDPFPALLPSFDEPRTVREVVSACTRDVASPAEREAVRKRVTQLVGRLYEAGLVEAID